MVTGAEQAVALKSALVQLGALYGLNRPLRPSELGRALRLSETDPGKSVRDWLAGHGIPGPAAVAVDMMLYGVVPPDGLDNILTRKRKTRNA
jgi:hypothetical protein